MKIKGNEIINFIKENKLENEVWTEPEDYSDNTIECVISPAVGIFVSYYINTQVGFVIEFEDDRVGEYEDPIIKNITKEEALKLRGLAE